MSSSHVTLDAAANERKARLAKLKSLKRKQPSVDEAEAGTLQEGSKSSKDPEISEETSIYLSGRNYDAATRGPKLGFEAAPSDGQRTLEDQARELAIKSKEQQAEEETQDKGIDLFKLQPKKPNWDLKRDLELKMVILNVRTENAIARLVRERIQAQQRKENETGKTIEEKGKIGPEDTAEGGDGVAVGMDGRDLVEGIHLREREEEENERREKEAEDDMD